MEILSTTFQMIPVLQDEVVVSESLTLSSQARPSMVLESIILSSHGLNLILDTGMFAWKLRKGDCQTQSNSTGSPASVWPSQ